MIRWLVSLLISFSAGVLTYIYATKSISFLISMVIVWFVVPFFYKGINRIEGGKWSTYLIIFMLQVVMIGLVDLPLDRWHLYALKSMILGYGIGTVEIAIYFLEKEKKIKKSLRRNEAVH